MKDPGVFGDFRVPENSRPPRIGDRCPSCGRALEWYDETATNGIDPEWWLGAAAECECGLELYYRPNAPHRVADRRHAAAMKYEDEQETGQLRLIG